MAKLNITVLYDDLSVNATLDKQTAVLHIADIILNASIGTAVSAKDLISTDPNNDLKLGSDNKLLSQPEDFDLLAYYLLA